jgi:hypothetical protein
LEVPPVVPPPVPAVPGGLTPPEFAPAGLDAPLEAELPGADAPDDPPAAPEGELVVAVVLVRVFGVVADGRAADPPGTVSAGAGLVRAEVEPPPPPPQPASPAASVRHGATTASARPRAST